MTAEVIYKAHKVLFLGDELPKDFNKKKSLV